MSAREYAWNVLVAIDMLFSVLLRGRPGVTLSARAYTAKLDGRTWGIALSWALNKIQPDHTDKAVQSDLRRAQAVADELNRRG